MEPLQPVYRTARLFIAVNFDDEVKERLLSVRDQIKAQSVKGNFTRPENLHLTLVFLGETPQEQIPAVCSAITAATAAWMPPVTGFTLDFTQTGCFKHSGKELWWIGADKNASSLAVLIKIRQQITGGLSQAGVSFDNRSFNPHITLGREIKHNAPLILPEVKITVPVNRISLMKSERIDGKLVYSEVFWRKLKLDDFYL